MIRYISTSQAGWKDALRALLDRVRDVPEGVEQAVRDIIRAVRESGDTALVKLTRNYDGFDPEETGLIIEKATIDDAYNKTSSDMCRALNRAADRIRAFHDRQRETSWTTTDASGIILGQKVGPLDSVGIYVPGGKNAFPSTLLMNVIPAVIAGVENIEVVSPTPEGSINTTLLAAARIAGIDRIYRIGGAQAVAALAYGTESIPRVDKVVGPGNIYVALAKRMLQGTIGIDSFAGPSEILVIADEGADARVVASDLLSQAEHDTLASSILITPSDALARAVCDHLDHDSETLPRKDVIRESLGNHGACIVTRDLDEAFDIANTVAPEHLELMLERAVEYVGKVKHAGAIFLGYHSPEVIGDYIAGPNHTLPTGSTARFSSPLGVYDFMKRSSIIGFSLDALEDLGPLAIQIARAEDLEAHARSVESRIRKSGT
ncbi:MAG: histidinol dehydrogenase [Desulfomonilia bacterium]